MTLLYAAKSVTDIIYNQKMSECNKSIHCIWFIPVHFHIHYNGDNIYTYTHTHRFVDTSHTHTKAYCVLYDDMHVN